MTEYKHYFICGLCDFKFPVKAVESETHIYSHHCNGIKTTIFLSYDKSGFLAPPSEDLPLEALDAEM